MFSFGSLFCDFRCVVTFGTELFVSLKIYDTFFCASHQLFAHQTHIYMHNSISFRFLFCLHQIKLRCVHWDRHLCSRGYLPHNHNLIIDRENPISLIRTDRQRDVYHVSITFSNTINFIKHLFIYFLSMKFERFAAPLSVDKRNERDLTESVIRVNECFLYCIIEDFEGVWPLFLNLFAKFAFKSQIFWVFSLWKPWKFHHSSFAVVLKS